MTEEELTALERLAERATPGPWVDWLARYADAMNAYKKRHGVWYHGTAAWSTPVVLIGGSTDFMGQPLTDEDIPGRADFHDLKKVIGWRWGMLKRGTTAITEGFLSPEDTAFICASRAAVPALIAEVRRLRAALGETGP